MRCTAILLLSILLAAAGCSEARQSEQFRSEAVWPPDVPAATCPGTTSSEDPTNPGTYLNPYVPSSVTSSATNERSCQEWLAAKERLLCHSTYYHNQATSLGAGGGTPEERLTYFRAAVETLTNLLFDQEDWVWEGNPGGTFGELFITAGSCKGSSFPVEPLKYYRRIKLKALELYEEMSEFYVYAFTAQGDAARSITGTTESYGHAVWGMDALDLADFTAIDHTYRGLGAAYLLGTDTVFLGQLIESDPAAPDPSIELACGGATSYSAGCPQRMIVPLQPCTVDAWEKPVATGLRLLRAFGAPVGSDGRLSDSGAQIARHLLYQVNQERWQNAQPQLADEDELLGYYGTDTASLALASRHLEEERGLYLRDLTPVTGAVGQLDFLKGFDGAGYDVQGLLLRSRVSSSRFGIDESLLLKNGPAFISGCPFCPLRTRSEIT